ncbi:MAG: hypothetical protein RIC57_12620 [Balneola sp.]|tara:strand:+ start:59813 stop:60376 length:564 start_codon:yes stop_codon:yes gene_type:complete
MKRILFFLSVGLLVLNLSACKTSEVPAQPETETAEQQKNEDIPNQEVEKQNPAKEIVLVVNGIVKYNFVKTDTNWAGKVTQFSSADPEKQEVVKVLEIEPTLGWDDFEEFVNYLRVYNIPDQSEIKNRNSGSISNISRAYQFFTFDGENSRSFSYYNPEGELNEHWQSRNVVTFGTYLISEMKVVEN